MGVRSTEQPLRQEGPRPYSIVLHFWSNQVLNHALLPNIYDFISRLDPFDKLSHKLLEQIAGYIQINYLAKSDSISREQLSEGYLFIIRSGAIEQSEINGELRARMGPGDLFGFTMVLNASEPLFQAEALENTLLYMLPANYFRLLLSDPAFTAYFSTHARGRLKSALQYSLASDNCHLLQTVLACCSDQFHHVEPSTPIRQVAQQMAERQHSSTVICRDGKLEGMISDPDLVKRVLATGMDTNQAISSVMTKKPPTIDADGLVLQAITKMMRYGVQNLPILQNNRVVGIVNAIDFMKKSSAQAIYLIDAIQSRNSIDELVKLMPQRQAIFAALIASEIKSHLVTQVLTLIMDAITARLIQLAQKDLITKGLGDTPCDFVWMAAGSQARYELQMTSDQDNAIVLSDHATESDRQYFQQLAEQVCNGLAACGYPLCSGDVMASNPQWRQTISTWKNYYTEWVLHPESRALLNASIFLDIRAVHGESSLVQQLQQHMNGLIKGNARFISILTANSLRVSPPLGFFQNFLLVRNGENKSTFNIKKRGVSLMVDLARIYGLLAGCEEAGTVQRLQYALQQKKLNQANYDDLLGAYNFICGVRLRQQTKIAKHGQRADNYLSPKALSSFERNHLKNAFRIIAAAQEAVRQTYVVTERLR